MVKEKVWYIEVDRKWFEIKYYLENGRPYLTANGDPVDLQLTRNKAIDQSFTLNNKAVRLVVYDDKADIAVDGVFESSKEPAPTAKGTHWWSWVFVAANLCMLIVAIGFVPAFIAAAGAAGCAGVYKIRGGTVSHLITSVFITAAAWGLLFAFLRLMYPPAA